MFTEDKVIEIFFMADEFCKFFNAMMEKYTLQRVGKRNYHRNGTLSKAEVMVIIILFHNSRLPLPEAFLSGTCLQASLPPFPTAGVL